ncbi:permease, partial [Myxococcota bacterium]|nr:permease [Myxococcota bacterium]
ASPMINEVAVVVLAQVLGWRLATLYVVAGLIVAYFGGVAMGLTRPERWVEGYVWDLKVGEAGVLAKVTGFAQRHAFAVHEVREILGRIWKWVLIGVGAGALFHGFVPQAWVIAHLGGDNLLAVPAAVLIGVPLYANATGVIPVAEALLSKGVAMGTVLAFMMSVAALSLPEMLILRRVIRWPALALYAGLLAVAFTCVGWGFNLFALSLGVTP